jgi:hypothetical protein
VYNISSEIVAKITFAIETGFYFILFYFNFLVGIPLNIVNEQVMLTY